MGGIPRTLWSSRIAGPRGILGLCGHFYRKHLSSLWQATRTSTPHRGRDWLSGNSSMLNSTTQVVHN